MLGACVNVYLHNLVKSNCTLQIGNAVINHETDDKGVYDYLESHALISHKTLMQIHKYCDFSPNATSNPKCNTAQSTAEQEVSDINVYSIYSPVCTKSRLTRRPKKISVTSSLFEFGSLAS